VRPRGVADHTRKAGICEESLERAPRKEGHVRLILARRPGVGGMAQQGARCDVGHLDVEEPPLRQRGADPIERGARIEEVLEDVREEMTANPGPSTGKASSRERGITSMRSARR
jgi:hypothetical protein